MADTTDRAGLPYPEPSDPTDVPADIEALAQRVAQLLGHPPMTALQRDALSAADRYAGRGIWNEDAGRTETWDGDRWDAGPRIVQIGYAEGATSWSSTDGTAETVCTLAVSPTRVGNILVAQAVVPIEVRHVGPGGSPTVDRFASVVLRRGGTVQNAAMFGRRIGAASTEWRTVAGSVPLMQRQTVVGLAQQQWTIRVTAGAQCQAYAPGFAGGRPRLIVQEVQL